MDEVLLPHHVLSNIEDSDPWDLFVIEDFEEPEGTKFISMDEIFEPFE